MGADYARVIGEEAERAGAQAGVDAGVIVPAGIAGAVTGAARVENRDDECAGGADGEGRGERGGLGNVIDEHAMAGVGRAALVADRNDISGQERGDGGDWLEAILADDGVVVVTGEGTATAEPELELALGVAGRVFEEFVEEARTIGAELARLAGRGEADERGRVLVCVGVGREIVEQSPREHQMLGNESGGWTGGPGSGGERRRRIRS